MKVLLATPSSRDPKWGFVICLLRLIWQNEIPIGFYICMSSSLCENRREIVNYAREHDYSHIFWLDDDMVFPADTLKVLLEHDLPLVGCNCTTRKPPVVTTAVKDGVRVASAERSGLEEVDVVGLAVMLTRTAIFGDLPEPWFATPFDKTGTERVYLGEDVFFCRLAKHFGHKIMIDHDLSQKIGHVGDCEYNHGMVGA